MPKKAVMISIRPEWCHLIAQGKKTVEVRKTKPEMGVPFKCYIYCTLSGCNEFFRDVLGGDVAAWNRSKMADMKGMVCGEFVCRNIDNDTLSSLIVKEDAENILQGTCLTKKELLQYLGYEPTKNNFFQKHYEFFCWNISDLVIYDKPKRIAEFAVIDNEAVQMCFNRQLAGQPEYVTQNDGWLKGGYICHKNGEPDWCTKCKTKPLKRPPQSWCYVMEG